MNHETSHNTASDERQKRKAADTLIGDDDGVNHSQPQLLYASQTINIQQQQQPSASNGEPSIACCQCVNCKCGWHEAMTTKATTTEGVDLDSLPIGYRFVPTDEELIIDYLEKKIKNEYLPKTKISDADIYEYHPKDLLEEYPQAIEYGWFFFTPRSRKYPNGYRPDRQTGSGYWKATGPDRIIKANDKTIGRRKSLVYHEGRPPHGIKTKWKMHEYVTEGYVRTRLNSNDNKLDDYVLCKIYINGRVVAANNLDENATTNVRVENEQALVPQHACVVSNQVKNDVMVQNYQTMGSLYDQMPSYLRSHYSSTRFNHEYSLQRSYVAPTPQQPPTPRGQVHAVMYQSGSTSNPVPPQVAPPFQEGGACDTGRLLRESIERTYALNGNDDFFGGNYGFEFDNEHIDVDEWKKHI
ncbi:putative transcription factor NAM family [Helianthus annuus]|uniref:Putative NAC domain-containing protein n=1 Tax=Helianthus annuus TaxID=4232 RepID=A0A251SRJ0_HELAN|nr:NAC domain-containing protein 1 [Helianthus annuus]KAF5773221.1 putative transcription factor NAM family [Helianthus annuus]KAJ0481044.1 putative transcription factor NAM family [Helianthus annuus]KAJ0497560.1 putative transcription factor NAM family [Helianthus annuus]KAJ0671065.1 putative transcription factor NAM family [Helianthus annuus]KAJ0858054.1 putative transcription factor NAM family [Helianthus annuus]